MKVTYRIAEQSDFAGIYDVEKSSFLTPWLLESLIYDVYFNPVSIYIVALADNSVIGFCGAHVNNDEGHINNVAVLTAFRRCGVGQGLVSALMTLTHDKVLRYALEVRQSNTSAINLYQKFGFCSVGIHENYYADTQEDAVLMAYERTD